MASIEHKVSVSVTGIEPLKELLELLHSNYESLPSALKRALIELSSDGKTVWDINYFAELGIAWPDIEVYLDGKNATDVMEIWPDTCEAVSFGKGVTKHNEIQVRNAKTGEHITSVGHIPSGEAYRAGELM